MGYRCAGESSHVWWRGVPVRGEDTGWWMTLWPTDVVVGADVLMQKPEAEIGSRWSLVKTCINDQGECWSTGWSITEWFSREPNTLRTTAIHQSSQTGESLTCSMDSRSAVDTWLMPTYISVFQIYLLVFTHTYKDISCIDGFVLKTTVGTRVSLYYNITSVNPRGTRECCRVAAAGQSREEIVLIARSKSQEVSFCFQFKHCSEPGLCWMGCFHGERSRTFIPQWSQIARAVWIRLRTSLATEEDECQRWC